LPTKFELLCPEECRCEKEGYLANCSDSGLNSIPSYLPTYARNLMLNGNNVISFENGTFVSRGLVELEIILANLCKLRKIELGAFNGLTKLIILSMAGNKISEIIPGTFEKLNRLEMLVLNYNIIEHLEGDVFSGLVNLKALGLEENKLQTAVPPSRHVLRVIQTPRPSNTT
jgi:Leucine-rich repeat (LRR) protein